MSFLSRFVKEPMNLIDFVAICPFYISLILEGLEDFAIIGKTGKIIRLVRSRSTLNRIEIHKKTMVCNGQTHSILHSNLKTEKSKTVSQVRVMLIILMIIIISGASDAHFEDFQACSPFCRSSTNFPNYECHLNIHDHYVAR